MNNWNEEYNNSIQGDAENEYGGVSMKRVLSVLLVIYLMLTLLPTAAFAQTTNESDFVIENGVLKKYTGDDEIVVIPDGVTQIGSYAFYKNKTIKEVVLPSTVKFIRDYAFSCCSKLQTINLPNGLQEIGWQAFCRNYYLNHVVIPETVVRLEGNVFYRCDRLADLTIPKTLTDFTDETFNTTLWYKNTYANEDFHILNNVLIGVSDAVKQWETVEIPEGVVSIQSQLFTEYDELNPVVKNVILPDTVVRLKSAFCGLSEMETIVLPQGIQDIGSSFKNCRSLKEIEIPEGVTEISAHAFKYCFNLEKVVLPSTVNKIGTCAFDFCKNLKEINIPDGVTQIGQSAFSSCDSLEKVVLPQGITTLGNSAFWGCERLIDITVPTSLTDIGVHAFGATAWFEEQKEQNGMVIVNQLLLEDAPVQNNTLFLPDGITSFISWAPYIATRIVIPPSVTDLSKFDYADGRIKTVYGVADSYAEKDALKHNAKFIPLALKQNKVTLIKGQSYTLAFNSGSPAVWKSDDSTVVSVDQNGKVTAKKAGTATITATLYGKDYTCKVTVSDNAYTVKRGDTLWGISRKYLGAGIRYKEIMELNGLKSTLIHAGKKLYLPEK